MAVDLVAKYSPHWQFGRASLLLGAINRWIPLIDVIWAALRYPKGRPRNSRQDYFWSRIAGQIPTNGRLMPIHQLCYLVFSVFHEDINLISFSLCSDVDGS